MTVENTNSTISYTGNNSATTFAYDFLSYSEDHLFVYFDDVEQTIGFTITGIGEDSGGDIIFDVAPGSGVIIRIDRTVPETQLIEYQEFGPFPAKTNERGLDLGVMGNQQIQRDVTRNSSKKMDKQPLAIENNIIIFDDEGNSKDSGFAINNPLKMDKQPLATENNIIVFDGAGNSRDSGFDIGDIDGFTPIEQERQVGDNIQEQFDTPSDEVSSPFEFQVRIDGLRMRGETDYTTDTIGKIDFITAPGNLSEIDITWYKPLLGIDSEKLNKSLINDLSQSYEFNSLEGDPESVAESLINFPIGKTITVKEREIDQGGAATWDIVLTSSVTPNGLDIVQLVSQPTLSIQVRYNYTISAKAWGVVGDGIANDTLAVQNILDKVKSNTRVEFGDCQIVKLDKPVQLMGDTDWPTGFVSNKRENVFIDLMGAELIFADSVDWSSIYPDTPIEIRGQALASSIARQPSMVIMSGVDFSIKNGTLNANMQARALIHGIPPVSEQEHCLKLISCTRPIVQNIKTQDSMGDGVLVGYPYTNNLGGPSAFFGADSFEGNCTDINISQIKAYRHARLGMAIIGCVRGTVNDIYAEDIFNVPDFKSANGPGATLDLEYDTSKSFYSGLGFSAVEHVTVNGVKGKNNNGKGALVVSHSRHCTVNTVEYTGNVTNAFADISGDISGDDGPRNNVVNGLTVRDGVSTNRALILGGKDCFVNDVKLIDSSSPFLALHLSDSEELTVTNLTTRNYSITTGAGLLFEFPSGSMSTGVTYKDTDLEINAAAGNITGIINVDSVGTTAMFDGIKITSPDNSSFFSSLEGVVTMTTATLCDISLRNIQLDVKCRSLYRGAQDNTVSYDGGFVKSLRTFPWGSALSTGSIKNLHVRGFTTAGRVDEAMMYILHYDNTNTEIENVTLESNGTLVADRATKVIIVNTNNASFLSVVNASLKVNGLIVNGQDTDGSFNTVANDSGGVTVDPWTDSTVRARFDVNGVNMNGHLGSRVTALSGSTFLNVGSTSPKRFTFIPNQRINAIHSDSFVDSFYMQMYMASTPTGSASRIRPANPPWSADQEFILTE